MVDHIGRHLASYGFIVMSHGNDTPNPVPPVRAWRTTMGHTDAFLDMAQNGSVAEGQLVNHVDARRIVWIGHSRGAEGVATAYDRLFDGTHTPMHFGRADIKLVSSMLPTDFDKTPDANPQTSLSFVDRFGRSDVDGAAIPMLPTPIVERATIRPVDDRQGTPRLGPRQRRRRRVDFGPEPTRRAPTVHLVYLLPLIKP